MDAAVSLPRWDLSPVYPGFASKEYPGAKAERAEVAWRDALAVEKKAL